MVEALQVEGLVYAAFGGLYIMSRETSLSRWLRIHGTKTNYGAHPATVREKESTLYFRIIAGILGLGGLAFGVVSQFVSYTNLPLVFLLNIPFLVCVLVLGFDSHVIDINGLVGVYPRGSVKRFSLALLFSFVYPLVAGIWLAIAGYIPLESTPLLSSVFVIPFAVSALILFLPLVTGEWLFGDSGFVESLPSTMKSFAFRTYMPVMLALVWSEVVPPRNILLLSAGFAVCFLLALGLRRISDD